MGRRQEWITAAVAGIALSACAVKDKLYCETDQDCADNPGRPYCDVAGIWPQSEGIGKTCIASPFDAGVPDPIDAAVDAPPIDAAVDGRPDATPPPDGPPPDAAPCKRKIAFTSNRTGNNEIFVMNEDGTDPTDLTNSAASDTEPEWSADGEWIAFLSDRTGIIELFVMSSTGASPTQASTCPGGVTNFTWKPDSVYLVYGCRVSSTEEDLHRVLRVGLMPLNMTSTVGGHNAVSSISADGKWIAFQSDRTGDLEIFKMDIDGANLAQLTDSPLDDLAPKWSPNGTKLVFMSKRGGISGYPIYIMNADGSGQALLRDGNSAGAIWSPDGLKLAVTARPGSVYEIVTMNANATNQVTVSTGTPSQAPAWSPDSTKVVFQSPGTATTDVFVSNVNGTGYADLTPTAGGKSPSWQPICH